MKKWLGRIIAVGIIGFLGFAGYDYYRAGHFTRPEMRDGEFSISYSTGLRAILTGVPNERETRRYLGYPNEVPYYLEDVWSICSPPTPEELSELERPEYPWSELPGKRFEVICKIDVDGDIVVRGIIITVPKL